jgi:hypothetical protein
MRRDEGEILRIGHGVSIEVKRRHTSRTILLLKQRLIPSLREGHHVVWRGCESEAGDSVAYDPQYDA